MIYSALQQSEATINRDNPFEPRADGVIPRQFDEPVDDAWIVTTVPWYASANAKMVYAVLLLVAICAISAIFQ